MRLFQALRSIVSAPLRRTMQLLDYTYYTPGVFNWGSRDFLTLAKEGYIENATAYACINEIATAMAGIPWKVMKKQANGKPFFYPEHPLLELVTKPNRQQTGAELTEAEVSFYYINGQSFSFATGRPLNESQPLTAPPTSLICPRPDLVRIKPDEMGLPMAYQVGKQGLLGIGSQKDYHYSRVMDWKTFDPLQPLFGLAPLKVAGKDVDTQNALMDFFYRLLKRQGRPEGVVLVQGALTDEQYARQKEQVNSVFNDARTPNGWKLFEGTNVDVKEFSHKPVDMALTQQELAKVTKICSVFKVPPEVIGVAEAKTYSNFQEARKAFYVECVLPRMDSYRDKRNQFLSPYYNEGKDHLVYDVDGIEALQQDRMKVREMDQKDEQEGRTTANEYRRKYGMPDAEDDLANQRMLSFSRVPADEFASGEDRGQLPTGTAPEEEDKEDDDAAEKRSRQKRSSLVMLRGLDAALTWRAFDDRRWAFLRSSRTIFQGELRADYQAAARALRASMAGSAAEAEGPIFNALNMRRVNWQGAYKRVYLGVALDFADSVDAGLVDSFGAKRQRRAKQDTWEAQIARYLETQGGTRITQVSDTTRTRIMASLARGFEAGMGADDMATQLEEAAAGATAGRSLRIARTEVITASNLGSDAAARAFGVPLNKSWLATFDGRERDTHAEADEQTVGLDGAFTVGGAQLMFPGDSSLGAPPEEVIECRCAVTYDVA